MTGISSVSNGSRGSTMRTHRTGVSDGYGFVRNITQQIFPKEVSDAILYEIGAAVSADGESVHSDDGTLLNNLNCLEGNW